jgi:hypothetical protein
MGAANSVEYRLMGALFSSPSIPATPAIPPAPPAATPPTMANPAVSMAGNNQRAMAAAAAGAAMGGTVTNVGGPGGLTGANQPTTAARSLLG